MARLRGKQNGKETSYEYNPFEVEAHRNEETNYYLRDRKRFAWLQYIGKSAFDD